MKPLKGLAFFFVIYLDFGFYEYTLFIINTIMMAKIQTKHIN